MKKTSFLQSTIWQKFQEASGNQTHIISDSNFHALLITHTLPIVGNYYYIPQSPVLDSKNKITVKENLDKIIYEAKKSAISWVRIEPETQDDLGEIKEALPRCVIVKAPRMIQPEEELIIALNSDEEKLLKNMKAKTRYNINLAKKRGITIQKINNPQKEDIEKFYQLTSQTSIRKKITPWPQDHYIQMFRNIPTENIALFFARYKKEVLATNIVIYYNNHALYLHGASSDYKKNFMAPFLLQWHQIIDAKKNNCTTYSFGGVHVTTQNKNDWSGITRFKTGFAPNTLTTVYPGTYDIVINPSKYYLYRTFHIVKNIFNRIYE